MEGNDFILRENRKNNYNGIGIWLSRLKETNTDMYIYLNDKSHSSVLDSSTRHL